MNKILFIAFILISFQQLHALSEIIPKDTIRSGMSIDITVYGFPQYSRTVTVNPAGNIDFPFLQNLPITGLTLEKLRQIIVTQLSHHLDTFPVVTTSFAKHSTLFVSVLGQVARPGLIQLPQQSTMQAAISLAGGTLPGAKRQHVKLLRQHNNELFEKIFNLDKVLFEGDLLQDPTLLDGDIIVITANPLFCTVKVLGSVNAPGSYESFFGATVLDMIFLAGGPTKEADLNDIKYISPALKKSSELHIDLKKWHTNPTHLNLPNVTAGDIIYVPDKKNYWGTGFKVLKNIALFATPVYYLMRIND